MFRFGSMLLFFHCVSERGIVQFFFSRSVEGVPERLLRAIACAIDRFALNGQWHTHASATRRNTFITILERVMFINIIFCLYVWFASSILTEAADVSRSDSLIRLLSPFDGATLVASTILTIIQFPVPGYQLINNEWILCFRTNLSGKEEELCWDDYSGASCPSTNDTFVKLLPVNNTGKCFLEVTLLSAASSNRSAGFEEFRVRSDFQVVHPFKVEVQDGAEGNHKLADFTYLNSNSFDMMRMRLQEHQADYVLLVDSDETHSGLLDKKLVVPDTAGKILRPSANVLYSPISGATVEVSVQELANCTCIEPWYFHRGITEAATAIFVHRPPSEPVANLREPLHRDILSVVAKRLEIRNGYVGAPDPEMYIVSDTDELIHRSAIRILKKLGLQHGPHKNGRETIVFFQLDFHLYNLNWKFPNLQWGAYNQEGAFVAPASLVRRLHTDTLGATDLGGARATASGIRRLLRPVNRQLLLQLAAEYNIVYWDHAGWHLSRFNSPAEMARAKKMAFTHGEEAFMNKVWTEENCALMQDMGVPHFMLESGKYSISSIIEGTNPLLFYPITDLPLVCNGADAVPTPEVAQDSLNDHCVNVHDTAVLHNAVAAWETEHDITLPLAVYLDRELLLRNVLRLPAAQLIAVHADDTGARSEAIREPNAQSRLSAAERLVDIYSAALPPSTAGGQVTYTASVGAGTFVQFACFISRTVRDEGAIDTETRTLAQQELAFYREEVIDKLFCEDKVRCPYERTEAAIDFVIPWVQSRCETTKGRVAFIKIHEA